MEQEHSGARSEYEFRRAAFHWAIATKRLVESSVALGKKTKVAHAALVDIEYATRLLDGLFMPSAMKPNGALLAQKSLPTAKSVKGCVSDFAERVFRTHNAVNLKAPVRPRSGKMLWAGVDCPVCPSKATQRCQRADGVFMERPHYQRKSIVEQPENHQLG